MKTQRVILTLLALAFILAPQSLTTSSAARKKDYSAQLLSPRAGEVLFPGQVVRLEWKADFPEVDVTMCETEIMLSLDGGRTFTWMVTEIRDPRVQYFYWTVPKTPTQRAVLDIRFGCLALYPETPSPQIQSTFVISAMN